ncbi:hypothetical protein SPONN_709 [uncultured Candidatus Thioglobus sp.]|nr:hypothetical protein SPONN_709 [uncultured Candidatus Thioglobus sp.]
MFSEPASKPAIAKLYTITQGKTLLYVGITKQRVSSRLNYGLKANGKKGYHGYKWKDITDVLQLGVWTIKDGNNYIDSSEIEIIEAEVVYLCRHKANQWSKYQYEIHFHQSKKHHRDLATEIYNLIPDP